MMINMCCMFKPPPFPHVSLKWNVWNSTVGFTYCQYDFNMSYTHIKIEHISDEVINTILYFNHIFNHILNLTVSETVNSY